jgi:hypothetical protein
MMCIPNVEVVEMPLPQTLPWRRVKVREAAPAISRRQYRAGNIAPAISRSAHGKHTYYCYESPSCKR